MLCIKHDPSSTNNNLIVQVINPEDHLESISFPVSSFISKRNKDDLGLGSQYDLVNSYLNHKGNDFKIDLYRRYSEAEVSIVSDITRKELYPLPSNVSDKILEKFNFTEVKDWLKNIYRYKAPNTLKDSFEEFQESVLGFTKDQTYIKDEYLDLVAFITILKTVLPTIAYYAELREDDIVSNQREVILFNFILRNKSLGNSPAVNKLIGMINKILSSPTNTADNDNVRVLEKMIAKEQMNNYLLSCVVVDRLFTANVLSDTDDKHIVNKIFGYVNMKLKPNGDVGKTIRDKEGFSSIDAGDGTGNDKESIVESHKIVSSDTVGSDVEYNHFMRDLNVVLHHLPVVLDATVENKVTIQSALLIDCTVAAKDIKPEMIDDLHFIIMGVVFKKLINPNILRSLEFGIITGMMGMSAAYLMSLGFIPLGLMMLSKANRNNGEEVFTMSLTANRARLSIELKDKIKVVFPKEREINSETKVNVVEEAINEIGNEIQGKKWFCLLNRTWLNKNNLINGNFIPSDIKIVLAEFLLAHEEVINKVKGRL